MARQDKKAKFASAPDVKKRPSTGTVDPDASADMMVTWRLAQVDFGGHWGWSHLAPGHMKQLQKDLSALEGYAFRVLKKEQKTKAIPVDHLCEDARKRLSEIKQDDVGELWELRLPTKKWRAWGIFRHATFYFVWWDPDHTVCKGIPQGVRR